MKNKIILYELSGKNISYANVVPLYLLFQLRHITLAETSCLWRNRPLKLDHSRQLFRQMKTTLRFAWKQSASFS